MKRTRRTPHPAEQSPDFGLIAWLENTRVALPLKGVECRFEVTGTVACVELDQIFHQNTDHALDCTYTFPLPAGAAVYRCELHINGRVIRAKVEAKDDARRIFREQTDAGRRAALVESERENLFTLSLGNVQPNDVIVVRFAWFQVLDSTAGGLRLLVPTCPGVRYIPGQPLLRSLSGRGTADDSDQVPDASRITPPRIDALHPDAAYFSIEGRLSSTDLESGTISSPSHPIYVRETGDVVTIELSGRAAVPDRDFVLAWREPKTKQLVPQAWHWKDGKETYVLLQLRAPEGVKVAEGYSQDVYFLVDRSGSMAGAKWQRTCEALRAFVSLLGAKDRVWITLFESAHLDFAETPMPAPAVLSDRGFQSMEALGTAGGTELLPAATHVLKQIAQHSTRRHASVVLITDGQVGNDEEIVSAFRKAPKVRVHTFGIDTTVNDAFLKSLARQQRGGSWLQTPDDDIAGTIAALGDRLRRPVITDLSAGSSWEPGRAMWPDLHAREVLSVALRGDEASPLEITGRLADGSEHHLTVELGTAGSKAVMLLWAKERIAGLLALGRKRQAIALARQHNLICEGAAFIAWDEAEQVPLASAELIQPAREPYRAGKGMWGMKMAQCAPLVARCPEPDSDDSFGDFCVEEVAVAGLAVGEDSARLNARRMRTLVTGLRKVLARIGVAPAASKRIVAWAQIQPEEAINRLEALGDSAELVINVRNEMDASFLRDRFEPRILEALSGPPDALLAWAKETRVPFHQVLIIRARLIAENAPKELADYLIAWLMEADPSNGDRLERFKSFITTFHPTPFSFGSKARRWRSFLESTVGIESKAFAVALQWMPELAATTAETFAPSSV